MDKSDQNKTILDTVDYYNQSVSGKSIRDLVKDEVSLSIMLGMSILILERNNVPANEDIVRSMAEAIAIGLFFGELGKSNILKTGELQ